MAGRARRADGKCQRCREEFGPYSKCQECGVHEDRPVMSMNSSRRKGKIGGKRGRNSGKVSQHGKK